MAFGARILADSLSPDDVRLTTFEVTIPRIVLAEFNTHRVFSRNSASSRAIPVKKMIERVLEDPYTPTSWGQNQKGMQAGEDVDSVAEGYAEMAWLKARDHAVAQAQELLQIGIHKQLTNRLLEPFMWHTIIVTATEWDNFFHLRNNHMAQPDIATPAAMMQELQELYEVQEPKRLSPTNWHLPLVNEEDIGLATSIAKELEPTLWEDRAVAAIERILIKVSVGRCARISYLTHEGERDLRADVGLHDSLLSSGHMSPFEHVARPIQEEDYSDDKLPLSVHHRYLRDPQPIPLFRETFCGNFRGWVQYRKTIKGESDMLGHQNTET